MVTAQQWNKMQVITNFVGLYVMPDPFPFDPHSAKFHLEMERVDL